MDQTDKILVCVDDEPIILMSLKNELRLRMAETGIAIEGFVRPTDALQEIDRHVEAGARVILVITDWVMPGMNGDEFILRVHERHPHIPLILVTGQADDGDIAKLREKVRLEAVIRKPWKMRELVATVQSCIVPPLAG